MGEKSLKERVERIENFLTTRLNADLDTIESEEQEVKDAFAEAHPDHAEATDLAEEQPEGSGKKDGPE